MIFESTPLAGLVVLEPRVFGDERGFFLESWNALWVPPGFAHGFYVLSEFADFQYKCSDYYHPASEVSLAWDDPTLGIEWPVPAGDSPKLSAKDAAGQAWGSIPLFD